MAGPLPGFNTLPASDLRRLRNLRIVNEIADLPPAIDGVITLEDWVTYDIRVNVLDLNGARIQCAENNALIGGYAENTRIISTGLTGPLISGSTSMRLANIELSAAHVFDLRGNLNKPRRVLRFDNLNIVSAQNVGTIVDYQVIAFEGCALRGIAGFDVSGSVSSFVFTQGLFIVTPDQPGLRFAESMTIDRRIRISDCVVINSGNQPALTVPESVTLSPDRYILTGVEFEGGGNYLNGIKHKDNRANWSGCKGIRNTIRTAEFGFNDNAQSTSITATGQLFPVSGTAQPGLSIGRFELSGAGAIYRGIESGMFEISLSLSLSTSDTREYKIALMHNGTEVPLTFERAKPVKRSDSLHRFDIHKLIWLEPGDRIEPGVCADQTGILRRDPIATDLLTIVKEVF